MDILIPYSYEIVDTSELFLNKESIQITTEETRDAMRSSSYSQVSRKQDHRDGVLSVYIVSRGRTLFIGVKNVISCSALDLFNYTNPNNYCNKLIKCN
jgi:hypothetical protein